MDDHGQLDRYETIVQMAGDGAYVLDEEGRFVLVNDRLVERTGYEREDMLGRRADFLVAADDVVAVEDIIRELLRDDDREFAEFEATVETADGGTYPAAVRMAPLVTDGEFRGTVGLTRDVTERKRRERELERYEQIVEMAGDGALVTDADGRIVLVNGHVIERTGYDREDLIGSHVSLLLDDAALERVEERLSVVAAADDRDFVQYEHELEAADGDSYPIEVRAAPIVEDGEVRGTVAVSRDVTERKERERKLRERTRELQERRRELEERKRRLERQNDRLERFASVVSHDLRNPLNVAIGRLELAREECESEHLDQIARAHDRMEQLIEDLLALAREGDRVEDPAPTDLGTVARDAWETVRTGTASLRVETDAAVRADARRLRQALENLFRNAIEHAGSDVTVTVGDLGDGFYVADDGPGIPPEDRERVFEPGYSAADDGTGLGLLIVAEIAEAHGWDVAVDGGGSASGEGAEDGADRSGARFEFTGVDVVGDGDG